MKVLLRFLFCARQVHVIWIFFNQVGHEIQCFSRIRYNEVLVFDRCKYSCFVCIFFYDILKAEN